MSTLSAALLAPLSLSGSRLANGDVNAGGTVECFATGTVTPITVYEDAEATAPWTAGAITLDAAGKADVYIAEPCDVVVRDQFGATVQTITVSQALLAAQIAVVNNGYTGTLANGSQGAGGLTDLDTVLTNLYTSFGAVDGKYKESTGATARTWQNRMAEDWVSPYDFGAVGDGATDDTTAVQAAINRVIARGGGTLRIPKGTFLCGALTVTPGASTVAVRIEGAGFGAKLKYSGTSGDFITVTSATGLMVKDLVVTASAGSSGAGINLANCSQVLLAGVAIDYPTAGHFEYALHVSGSGVSENHRYTDCQFTATGSNSAGVRLNGSGTCSGFTLSDCYLGGTAGLAIGGVANTVSVVGGRTASNSTYVVIIGDGTIASSCSGVGGVGVSVTGMYSAVATPFKIVPTGAIYFVESGNSFSGIVANTYMGGAVAGGTVLDASLGSHYGSPGWRVDPVGRGGARVQYKTATAGGTAVTPNVDHGNIFECTLTGSGGSTVTMNAPTGTLSPGIGERIRFIIHALSVDVASITWNAAYSLAAQQLLDAATAIPATMGVFAAGDSSVIDFVWDGATWTPTQSVGD